MTFFGQTNESNHKFIIEPVRAREILLTGAYLFIDLSGSALNLLRCIRCIYNYLFSCFLQPFFVVLFAASLRTVRIQMPGPSLCSLLTPFVCMYGNERGVEEGDLTSSSFEP